MDVAALGIMRTVIACSLLYSGEHPAHGRFAPSATKAHTF